MCARRFLIVVLVLILLFVAGAFAIFQFGERVLIRQAVPTGKFEAAEAGTGPDYADPASWVARPDLGANPSQWLPDGLAARARGNAAVFYIHPTTYLQRDRWNATLRPGGDAEFRTRLFAQSQASAFNGAGDVWAPRYRQAAFGAFLLDSEDARGALDLAYRDVVAAFDRFLAENGDGPIILAGHSQGALHLTRLLRERIAGKPLRQRVAAAYVVGWPISTAADLPALGLPACTAAEQPGCILSWLSFGAPANPELVLNSYEDSAGFAGGERRREDLLCVNPLTGTRNGSAPPAANPGTLVPSANLTSAELLPGRVGAACEEGLLVLGGEVPALGPYVLPGNNYHVYDFALFWGAIRQDAQRRLAAWQRR
jgi:pimeloyl-ACP methyl ester carboxylesterase